MTEAFDVQSAPCAAEVVAAELAAGASLELTPREVDRHADALAGMLPSGTRVFLTAISGAPLDAQLRAAERVRGLGFEPVPHVAARAHASVAELERAVREAVARAGVREVMLVAGSTNSAGTITSSLDVLRAGVLEAAGIARIGVAGYPEGTRGIPDDELRRAMAEKNAIAAERGLDLHVVTQFAFDANVYVAWERAARAEGNRLPVTVGLPGVSRPARLLRFALSCGVGASVGRLRAQTGVRRLATAGTWRPDELFTGICAAVAGDPASRIAALHLFAFGDAPDSARWLVEQAARGDSAM